MEVNKKSALVPLSFTSWPHGCKKKNPPLQSSMALVENTLAGGKLGKLCFC